MRAGAGTIARRDMSTAVPVAAALLAVALATWAVTIARMDGMDAGPGTDLGGLGWFLGVWVTMMAAMMFPSVAPMVVMVAGVADRAPGGHRAALGVTGIFVAGYLAVWTAFGLVAYAVVGAVDAAGPAALAWDRYGPAITGAAVAAAGVYQLTPLKRACLSHCRSPLAFVMHRWRRGPMGALRMGVEHGSWCLGCCIGLMLVLLVLGVMSITWMAAVAAAIFVEKALPFGARLRGTLALTLIGLGAWIAVAPDSVPALTEPGTTMAMEPPPAGAPHRPAPPGAMPMRGMP